MKTKWGYDNWNRGHVIEEWENVEDVFDDDNGFWESNLEVLFYDGDG